MKEVRFNDNFPYIIPEPTRWLYLDYMYMYSHCTLPNPCEAKTNVKIVISPLLKPTAA